MKSTHFLTALFCFLSAISTCCQADSELIVSRSFNILAINGALYNKGLIDQDRHLNLKSGNNRLVIEYEEVFESDQDDNFDIVKSSPFLLQIYLQNNASYRQRLVKPSNADAARQFARQPLFEIVQVKGKAEQKVNFELSALAGSNETYLLEQSRIPVNGSINITSANSDISANKPSPAQSNGQSMASKMLDYWWQQATPEERERFLQSINR